MTVLCDRNECVRAASMRIVFDRYPTGTPATKACLVHAQWWTKGFDGSRTGRAVGISQ